MTDFLKHSDFDLSLSGVISQVTYWLVILLFVITGANSLGLSEIAGMLQQLANYLPKIIVAIVVSIVVVVARTMVDLGLAGRTDDTVVASHHVVCGGVDLVSWSSAVSCDTGVIHTIV